MTKGLEVFEKLVESTKGKYCVGDEVSLADVFLIPQLYNAKRFGMDVETLYPHIHEIRTNLDLLPEFVKADADNQEDADK